MKQYTLPCNYCHSLCIRSSREIASRICRKRQNHFCSDKCARLFRKGSKIKTTCKTCLSDILKSKSQLRTNNFCSRSCAAKYNNLHKTKGTRRSKLEIFLEKQIRTMYPQIKLICNDKTAINSELDFNFPDLHLAIELNGILHFEPIYGNNKLEQIQTNDSKKSFLCHQHQINLAIIDSSTCKYLNESAKNKYWNIVQQIINLAG